ncbi:sterile alpha motif domain-containing protein 1-like [Panthera uncia]|uniref:sterile alpha motif domain-containing protein 1-like n=1 Tax=Panthera uncia TaxID=29064 RepID=UPI0020FFC2C4|nr:sterile alpha motif domain-containing protein 1-like [Panthera uncia]
MTREPRAEGATAGGRASRPGGERHAGDPLRPRLERTRLQREQAELGPRPLPGAVRSAGRLRQPRRAAPPGTLPQQGAARRPHGPRTPARPPPDRAPEPPASCSRRSPGRGLRRHRGGTDYSADKAGFLRPPQLSNCNRHTAAWERGPRFPERRLASFLRPPSGRLPVDPALPSTHPPQPSEPTPLRSAPFSSLPLQTLLPWPASGPLSPAPLRDHNNHILLRLCPWSQLTRKIALHPFSSLLPWGTGNGRLRVLVCKVWRTDLLSSLPGPSSRLFPGTRGGGRGTQQSPPTVLRRQLLTVAVRSGEEACEPGLGRVGVAAPARGACAGRGSRPARGRPGPPAARSLQPHPVPYLGPPAGCGEGAPAARLQWRLQKARSEGAGDRASPPPPPPPPPPPLRGAQLAAYCQRGR